MFLIHYGWRGTAQSYYFDALSDLFLIHYGWRGTLRQGRAKTAPGRVSNPLRLAGDRSFDCDHGPPVQVSNPLRLEGDVAPGQCRHGLSRVSNPLRLAGDNKIDILPASQRAVSNPLRLEGDRPVLRFRHRQSFVSNPLRLEGNVALRQNALRHPEFLIHYGWRGTQHRYYKRSVSLRF